MTGHIRRRGKQSWELKFEIGRNAKGQRITQYHSFKGTKKAAEFKLAELIAAVGKGAYVERPRQWRSLCGRASISGKRRVMFRLGLRSAIVS